jgi:hypothetical protein
MREPSDAAVMMQLVFAPVNTTHIVQTLPSAQRALQRSRGTIHRSGPLVVIIWITAEIGHRVSYHLCLLLAQKRKVTRTFHKHFGRTSWDLYFFICSMHNV